MSLRRSRLLVAGCLWMLVVLACSPGTTSRADWERMSHEDRVLYVESMLGGERAKDAKGGRGQTYTRPPAEYVREIDAAYARGDARDAQAIFADLATR